MTGGGVYIAGPMRGYPAYNFAAFEAAQHAVEQADNNWVFDDDDDGGDRLDRVDICNPAWLDIQRYDLVGLAQERGWQAAGQWLLDNPQEFDLRKALGEDMTYIAHEADHIVLLPGWQDSKGACAEKALSEALGHKVWYLDATSGEIVAQDPASTPPPTLGEKMAGILRPGETVTVTDVAFGNVSSGGEVRTASSTGGEKGVKLARYDLIPVGPLRQLAEHYGRGASKYADNQWRRGYEFSKSIAALMRHFEDWRGGLDYDVCENHPEGCSHVDTKGNPFEAIPSEHGSTCFNHLGTHHLAAFLWHGMFLLEGTEHWPEHDDRFTYPDEES